MATTKPSNQPVIKAETLVDNETITTQHLYRVINAADKLHGPPSPSRRAKGSPEHQYDEARLSALEHLCETVPMPKNTH